MKKITPHFKGPTATEWKSLPLSRLDGIPLGNGEIGAVLWADGREVIISIDHICAWDERNDPRVEGESFNWQHLQALVHEGRHDEIERQFEGNPSVVYPTKLSAVRFRIEGLQHAVAFRWRLDLESGVASAIDSSGGCALRCYVHALHPVVVVEAESGCRLSLRPSAANESGKSLALTGSDVVVSRPASLLGYPPPVTDLHEEGGSYCQTTCTAEEWGASWQVINGKGISTLYVAVAFGSDALARAKATMDDATAQTSANFQSSHLNYWDDYWKQSAFTSEDPAIHHAWHVQHYLLGSTCRAGQAPIALQGVWSNDGDQLPPWHGDYHQNANVQFSYGLCLAANRIGQSQNLADAIAGWMPAFRDFARNFFQSPGLCVPAYHSLNGQSFPGWNTVLAGRFHGIWLLKLLWDHYLYTGDKDFLLSSVWPFLEGLADFAENQLKKGDDGLFHLLEGTAPEYGDNTIHAYLDDTNYEVVLVRFLYQTLIRAARVLARPDEVVARGENVLARLPGIANVIIPSWAGKPTEVIGLAPGKALDRSHRHHSQLMHLYPFDEESLAISATDRNALLRSLHDLDRLGTGEWVGFSFPWMACLGARLGESKRADRAIRESLLHFTSRNGFNRNGDFLDAGASSSKSDIFTLEANFLIAAAIQECCLQSHGGVVRVFPALPESWGPTRFENWRTEGAHSVSASLCETSLNIDILCGCSGPLLMDVPVPCTSGSSARHRVEVEIQSGDALQFVIRANQKPVLTLNSKIINHD